jgi:hypothetical protein
MALKPQWFVAKACQAQPPLKSRWKFTSSYSASFDRFSTPTSNFASTPGSVYEVEEDQYYMHKAIIKMKLQLSPPIRTKD